MIAEAGIIGLVASLVGLGLGLVLAAGLTALFRAMGLDMPQGDTVFATRTVVVSLLVGTVVTLLAGVVPAIRATRVPADRRRPRGRGTCRERAVAPLARSSPCWPPASPAPCWPAACWWTA